MLRFLSARRLVAFALIAAAPCLAAQEKMDEAAARQGQAKQLWQDEQWLEAEKAYLDALKIYEKQMAAKHQQDALLLRWCECRHELVEARARMQKLTEAKALFAATVGYLKQVIPLRPKAPAFRYELARTHAALANGYQYLQLYLDAETQQRTAIDILKALVQEQPARAEYRLTLSQWLRTDAGMMLGLARFPEAEAAFQEAQQIAQKLVADAPKTPDYARELGIVQSSYSYLARESGRFPEAATMVRAACREFAKLEAEYPERPELWYPLPIAYRNLAQALTLAANAAEANHARREALRLEAKLAETPPSARKWDTDSQRIAGSLLASDPDRLAKQQQELENLFNQAAKNSPATATLPFLQARLAVLKSVHAQQLFARGLRDEARKENQAALAILEKLNAAHPEIPLNRTVQAEVHINLSGICMSEGQLEEGDRCLRQGLAILQKLADENPKTPHFRFLINDHLLRITVNFSALNQVKEATRYLKESQAGMKKLAEEYPACPKYCRLYAQSYANLARTLQANQAHPEAEAALRDGIRHWIKLSADFPATLEFRQNLARDSWTLGQFLFKHEKYQEAEEAFAEMLRIHQRLYDEHAKEPEFHTPVAVAYLWLGQVREKQERHADAVEFDSKAIALWESALQLNPRERIWLTQLRASVQHRSYLLLKLSKQAEYQADVQRCKELGEALDAPLLRLYRIEDRAQKGETALALKEADDLLHNVDMTDMQWHTLAVFYADQSAKSADAAQKEMLAARAVAALGHAIEQGYARAGLSQDAHLQALAGREDFRKLLQTK